MPARISGRLALVLAAVALVLGSTARTEACPFCGGPTLTLSERFFKADVALLVKWVDGQKTDEVHTGNTTFGIVRIIRDSASVDVPAGKAPVVKAPAVKAVKPKAGSTAAESSATASPALAVPVDQTPLVKGQKIFLTDFHAGKPGDLSLLMGGRDKTLVWSNPAEVTQGSFNYIMQAPPLDSPATKRLAYFLTFLENADLTIANDAYAEFANASYKDIVALAPQLPREKLRSWLVSKKISPTRLGLYGLMLGLCGDQADARVMEAKINESTTDDFRLGVDGIIGGYLLLTGDKGLDLVEKAKLTDKSIPSYETYAAIQALRFMWTYGDNKIPAERLRASMRLLLDRPELIDVVIADLARWKDWSIQKQLMQNYGIGEYDAPSTKRAIIRFMVASTKDVAGAKGTKVAPHVVAGARYLDQLRKKDPKTVADVERFFLQ